MRRPRPARAQMLYVVPKYVHTVQRKAQNDVGVAGFLHLAVGAFLVRRPGRFFCSRRGQV